MDNIEEKVSKYWTKRVKDFSFVRSQEMHDGTEKYWIDTIKKHLPKEKNLNILDVGTGTGFFSIILSKQGYRLTGIDLTPAMIQEAQKQAIQECSDAAFIVMDAQKLAFNHEQFDAIITRNLTWTLPEPETAYKDWYRVLKKGGVLLNFDANYGLALQRKSAEEKEEACNKYGHRGMTMELVKANEEITNYMSIGKESRPEWDMEVLKRIGFSQCNYDVNIGESVLKERNDPYAPMFLIYAKN